MNGRDRPTCRIIGPNGAGKTTFALKYLPEAGCQNFVNADLIAAGMSPLAPELERMSAGRLFLTEIQRHIQARHDFGFETTLAGRGYLRLIRRLMASGWRVEFDLSCPAEPGDGEAARRRAREPLWPRYPGSRYRTAIPSKLGEPDRGLCVACGSDCRFAQ
jgi:predicted ABC-type ATPase